LARHFTFLIASARRDGNTELLTRKAAEHLPAGYGQQWLHLMDLPLSPFQDIRHSVGVYPQPQGNERILFDATLKASDLVFAVPLYWYSVPASAKLYLDYWSGWLRVPAPISRPAWQAKHCGAFRRYPMKIRSAPILSSALSKSPPIISA